MKVAIVMPLGDLHGGVERMLMNLLRANLKGPRVDYTIGFLEKGSMVEGVRALGYPAQVFESGRLRQVHRYAQTVYALRNWLRQEQAQVVLSWAAKGHLYAGPAARSIGVLSAWYVHSLPDGHWMDRLVTLMPATKVFCCGKTAEQAQQQMSPHRSTCVVYIAVDLERFNPDNLPSQAEARRQLGLPEEIPLVGMVARLQRWKGVHVFLDAAARVAQAHSEARFVVIGGEHWSEPGYPGELVEQVRQAGLAERVLFAGHQENVPLWMQAMNVLVHASFDEPTGTVIIEGMALGKPVIAARTGGPMEFIKEGENGLLASPGNAEELADALHRLLSDAEEQRKMGTRAQASVQHFSADRLALDIARNLEDMLS